MIPKVIHYCWFGGNPLPKDAMKCIESWKKYLPDYEIRRWDESNFDVNIVPYTKEAFAAKKYAFVSDYARFWIIYNHGGLYFDTDVEVISSLEPIVAAGPFMGIEFRDADQIMVNPGLGFGAKAEMYAIKDLLVQYEGRHFIADDGSFCYKNIVEITTEYLKGQGLSNVVGCQQCAELTIYPVDYFCPIDYKTRELKITEHTKTIHHFAESWVPKSTRFKNAVGRVLGRRFVEFLVRVKHFLIKK